MTDLKDPTRETRRALLRFVAGYRSPAVLFAALELDLFTHIPREGATTDELASRCGVNERFVRILLNALVPHGLVIQKGSNTFVVEPEVAPFVRRGTPTSMVTHLLIQQRENAHWLRLAEVMRGKDPGTLAQQTFSGTDLDEYLELVEWMNDNYAAMLWSKLGDSVTSGVKQALDVGGGLGYFSETLLDRNPSARVTMLDFETSLSRCQTRFRGHPHEPRMSFEVGDARTLDRESSFDLIMANDLMHYFDRDEKVDFLRRTHRALVPGGRMAVMKFRLDDSGAAPPFGAMFSLKMLLSTGKAYLATDAEKRAVFEEAGFRDVQVIPVDETKTIVTGVRQ